jgi:hypothetical protein
VSKNHRQNRKPSRADWIVRRRDGPPALIAGATFTRDEHGGYTFTDLLGTVADFLPGTVLHVMRRDEPVVEAGGYTFTDAAEPYGEPAPADPESAVP